MIDPIFRETAEDPLVQTPEHLWFHNVQSKYWCAACGIADAAVEAEDLDHCEKLCWQPWSVAVLSELLSALEHGDLLPWLVKHCAVQSAKQVLHRAWMLCPNGLPMQGLLAVRSRIRIEPSSFVYHCKWLASGPYWEVEEASFYDESRGLLYNNVQGPLSQLAEVLRPLYPQLHARNDDPQWTAPWIVGSQRRPGV